MYFSKAPYIFRKAFSIVFCTVVDNENGIDNKRISSELTLRCYDYKHIYYLLLIVLPIIFIFTLIIPGVLFKLVVNLIKEMKIK